MNAETAFNELCSVIKTALTANSVTAIVWPDKKASIPTSGEWARVVIQHSDGGQDSLSDADGLQKYSASGIVYVQVFTEIGKSHPRGYVLADAVLNALRKASIPAMVLRKGRLREIGADGAFYQIQALSAFEYESHV